jgi:hypothetical protein
MSRENPSVKIFKIHSNARFSRFIREKEYEEYSPRISLLGSKVHRFQKIAISILISVPIILILSFVALRLSN